MQKSFIAATLAALAVASAASGAVVLANWTFEVSIPAAAGPFAAEAGLNAASSFASGSHVGAAVYSNPSGNGSVESFSSNTWAVGDYYQYTTSTAGYNNITIQWDQTSSNTGPRDFGLFASVDGGATFSQIGANYVVLANAAPNPLWNSTTASALYTNVASGGVSMSNVANVIIRMVQMTTISANGGVVAAGGTDRMDNVIISGDLVPTPGAISLVGLGGLVAIRRRR